MFQSNNDNSATVSPEGTVTAKNRGEAFVTARFATFTVGSQVVVIPQGLKYERPKLAANNYIDELVHDKTAQAARDALRPVLRRSLHAA